MNQNSAKGTIFKLNVSMEPIDDYHLADVDWKVEAFTRNGGRVQTIRKSDSRKVDEDNYVITVDSSIGGAGTYYLTLTAEIPDTDCPEGIRPERVTISTGVTIV